MPLLALRKIPPRISDKIGSRRILEIGAVVFLKHL